MAQESANSFVEKMFTDDEFLKEVVRHGGIKSGFRDEKNELILKAAKEMGFDFSPEEYQKAMKNNLGSGLLNIIKKLRRFNKVIRKAEKELG